jgi:hypothetical protein
MGKVEIKINIKVEFHLSISVHLALSLEDCNLKQEETSVPAVLPSVWLCGPAERKPPSSGIPLFPPSSAGIASHVILAF